jgi:hypothetical protein
MTQSLEAAARALLAKLHAAGKAIDFAIQIATLHHCPYTGPTYGEEMVALEAALAALPADVGPVDSERVGESDLLGGCLKGFRLLRKMLATAKMPAGVVVTEAWIVEIESAIRQGYVVTQADALAALRELIVALEVFRIDVGMGKRVYDAMAEARRVIAATGEKG